MNKKNQVACNYEKLIALYNYLIEPGKTDKGKEKKKDNIEAGHYTDNYGYDDYNYQDGHSESYSDANYSDSYHDGSYVCES